jgi:hypothetical protein
MSRWRRWLLRRAGHALLPLAAVWLVGIAGAIAGWWRPQPILVALAIATFCGSAILAVWARWQREVAVREAAIPQFLKRKLRESHPHLTGKDCDLVERGLRQFFLACLRSNGRFVAMPSRAVDAMWHEFILHTRAYRDWCELTLGRFLHHTPAEALGPKADTNDGLRRAWFWSCRDEAIDPKAPTRLPLLFALDAKLRIAGGFAYVADCGDLPRRAAERAAAGGAVHCGTSFADGSFSGDADSMGGVDASDGDSGDGGCGGD